jgi:hypothetical protein
MIEGLNTGRGRGRGVMLTRAQAREVLALIVLRRAGVPMQRLKPEARKLRAAGGDFLCVGADGKTVLLDGQGDGAPLRDPATGQTYLGGAVLDLRPMRAEIERVLDRLEAREAPA